MVGGKIHQMVVDKQMAVEKWSLHWASLGLVGGARPRGAAVLAESRGVPEGERDGAVVARSRRAQGQQAHAQRRVDAHHAQLLEGAVQRLGLIP